jgi:hypothetical protein
MDDLDDLLDDI